MMQSRIIKSGEDNREL